MGEKMKMISKATLLALLAMTVTFLVPAAHADSYLDYDITGTYQSGGTLSGFFVVDTTTNVITDGQMMADGDSFSCPDGYFNGCILGSAEGFLSAPGAPTSYSILELNWVMGSLGSDFNFTLNNSYCAYCATASDDMMTSGSAVLFGTDASPIVTDGPVTTPEPTTGLLLSLGLIGLGFAGFKQRSAINNA
jgi:hypothetical protein